MPPANAGSIEQVQMRLRRFGYLSADFVPGVELNETARDALRNYQQRRGLPEVGEVDEETLAATQRFRCGHPDLVADITSYVTTFRGNPWHRREITYQISFGPTKSSDPPKIVQELGQQAVDDAIETAFEWWRVAGPLTFTRVYPGSGGMPADIVISFESDREAHGSRSGDEPFLEDATDPDASDNIVLAHSFYPVAQSGFLTGDIHFNDDQSSRFSSGEVDLTTVAAHEIGHALGLGHMPDKGSLMFEDILVKHQCLPPLDAALFRAIYEEGIVTEVVGTIGPAGPGPKPPRVVLKHRWTFG